MNAFSATSAPQKASRIGDVSPEHLRALMGAPLRAEGFELVECRWNARQKTVALSIDHEIERAKALGHDPKRSAISLDDCQAATRVLSDVLDHQPPFDGDEEWTLEVSSPGVERPLLTARDYQRYVGLPVRLKLKADAKACDVPHKARRQWLDVTLESATDADAQFTTETQSLRVALDDIERAHLRLVF